MSCCSLASLLEQLEASDQQNAGIGSPGESWQVQPGIISLTLSEQGAVFDMQGKVHPGIVSLTFSEQSTVFLVQHQGAAWHHLTH